MKIGSQSSWLGFGRNDVRPESEKTCPFHSRGRVLRPGCPDPKPQPRNLIAKRGAVALADVLKGCALQQLDLSGNEIGERGPEFALGPDVFWNSCDTFCPVVI